MTALAADTKRVINLNFKDSPYWNMDLPEKEKQKPNGGRSGKSNTPVGQQKRILNGSFFVFSSYFWRLSRMNSIATFNSRVRLNGGKLRHRSLP